MAAKSIKDIAGSAFRLMTYEAYSRGYVDVSEAAKDFMGQVAVCMKTANCTAEEAFDAVANETMQENCNTDVQLGPVSHMNLDELSRALGQYNYDNFNEKGSKFISSGIMDGIVMASACIFQRAPFNSILENAKPVSP
ncbi:MAG: hypothetical protein GC136_05960 [Alphaproteobacteria bacterium]|nr:hypothetical protein [Alphaproteobacteria bacterium]